MSPSHEREDPASRIRDGLRRGRAGGSVAEARIARGLGEPVLFAITLSAVGSSIYFALGLVAGDAMGLTPVVFMGAGLFFVVTMLTYVEGNSLHPERGGASMFARYAFNELWSFIAGWAIILDYLIVMAIGAFAVSHYLAAFWGLADDGGSELVIAAATIGYVAWVNFRGLSAERYRFVLRLSLVSIFVFLAIVVVGVIQAVRSRPCSLTASISARSRSWTTCCSQSWSPRWPAPGSKPPRVSRASCALAGGACGASSSRRVRPWSCSSWASRWSRSWRCPWRTADTELGSAFVEAPVLGVVSTFDPDWLGEPSATSWARWGPGAGAGRERADARDRPALLLARHEPPDPQPAVAA